MITAEQISKIVSVPMHMVRHWIRIGMFRKAGKSVTKKAGRPSTLFERDSVFRATMIGALRRQDIPYEEIRESLTRIYGWYR